MNKHLPLLCPLISPSSLHLFFPRRKNQKLGTVLLNYKPLNLYMFQNYLKKISFAISTIIGR